ncbi:MAG TPA: NAD(P)H-binding protein [Pseudonocardiaceae bacterium]|nr:NAD(P)H-binding protein [Pseudonocardiaceae bacterium]
MIVVTGASGNVGRELVRLLGDDVRPVARNSGHRADLGDPASLVPVFAGADTLFLLVAGDRPAEVLDVAGAAGIRRVVLLSSQGAGTRPRTYRHPALFEDAVRRFGLEWTVLRPGGFHSNAFAWAQSVREHRTVAAPFPDVALPTVDPADIAEVAAAVLRDDGHAGATYELTGPEPTTPRGRAEAIGAALGEPIRFVEQSRAEARAAMLAVMPAEVVDGTLDIIGAPTPDEQRVSPDVDRVLGRAPRPFTDWVARNIQAFR